MRKPLPFRVQKRENHGFSYRAFGGKIMSYGPWTTLLTTETLETAREYANKRKHIGLGQWRIMQGKAQHELTDGGR
jgi:hypothetical protein